MTTRRWVLGAVCSCGAVSAAKAQWPGGSGPLGNPVWMPSALGGCAISKDGAIHTLADIVYQDVDTGDGPFCAEIGAVSQSMLPFFHELIDVLIYDDSGKPNAFACPERVFLPTRYTANETFKVAGTVLVGTSLLSNEKARTSHWLASAAMIVGHEYGHIIQFSQKLDAATVSRELHADYFGGWVLGLFKASGDANYSDVGTAEACLSRYGSYDYNNPTFHGTPSQRVGAMRAGYDCGLQSLDVMTAYTRGLEFLHLR